MRIPSKKGLRLLREIVSFGTGVFLCALFLAAWRLGGLAVALLALAPMGDLKADVVTLANTAGTQKNNTTSLFIRLVTTGSGAFQLGTLNLFGTASDPVSYALKNSSGTTINSIAGNVTMSNGSLALSSNLFGAGTYWLEISNLVNNTYTTSSSATLTASSVPSGITSVTAGEVSGVNSITAETGRNIFQASLTVNVPEPATMILTGSALVAGAIGVFIKRRRRLQTVTSA